MEINSVRELKELVELFGVIKAESNNVVSCNETVNELSNEELIKANENKFKKPWNDALLYKINALDIIKKHKHNDRNKTYLGLKDSDIEEIYKEFYGDEENSETVASCEEISSAKTDTISCNYDNVSKDKETNESKCSCFICSKEIKDKESIFKIPYLSRDYLNSTKKVEHIKICEKCLDANSWSIRRNKKHKKLKNGC
ncbi:TPA: hypothetical protein SOL41_003514 [Clostridioides difficile]|nr:hypothetical protein [Clostridioides difficile]HEK4624421.1 hypothetical protein [Clostridioides difficile]HEK4859194.1 hypothetical protein [Clostridioides difficile]